jgi:hypothetical protein
LIDAIAASTLHIRLNSYSANPRRKRQGGAIQVLPWDIGDDHVLVAVRLLPTTVMQGLFFRVFRPLATPFRAVDNEPRLRFTRGLALGKVTGVPLRTKAENIKGGLEDRQ